MRTCTGELVIRLGGCWDTQAQTYVAPPSGRTVEARVVRLKESQTEMGHALAQYIRQRLASDDARNLVLIGEGARGGGKTWLAGFSAVLIMIALPGSWQMGLNITAKQRREVLEAIQSIAAPEWITADATDPRDPFTTFITGSTLLWKSSRNPEAMREGGLDFEHVLINEGQDQPEAVWNNAVGAVRNTGGLVTVWTNPPQTARSNWVALACAGIDAGEVDGARYKLLPSQNDAIHQASQPKIRRALYAVSRQAGEADADGMMSLAGDLGYPAFSAMPREKGGHIGRPPAPVHSLDGKILDGWEDVTREFTAAAMNSTEGFDFVAGSDFQGNPGCCAVPGKLYRVVATGQLVFYASEFVTTQGTEADLSQGLVSRGYYPRSVDLDGNHVASCLLVGDATGARQNAEHVKKSAYSFARLRDDGWKVLPPMRHFRTGVDWNPLVADSRRQMHALLIDQAILFDPRCKESTPGWASLVEGFQRSLVTPAGDFVKKGHFTHGPDGVRYLAWRFLPRPKVVSKSTGIDHDTYDAIAGIRVLTNG